MGAEEKEDVRYKHEYIYIKKIWALATIRVRRAATLTQQYIGNDYINRKRFGRLASMMIAAAIANGVRRHSDAKARI